MNQPRPRTVAVVAGFLFAATGIALHGNFSYPAGNEDRRDVAPES